MVASAVGRTSRANRAATGRRRLLGEAAAGRTLCASTDGMEDAEELAGVFAFRWIADDRGAEADIAGETGPELHARGRGQGDQGAGFTEDAGHEGGADQHGAGAGRATRR